MPMFVVETCTDPKSGTTPLSVLDGQPDRWKQVKVYGGDRDDEREAGRKAMEVRDGPGWPVVRVRDGRATVLIMQRLGRRQRGKKAA